jgi:hypothetical protein
MRQRPFSADCRGHQCLLASAEFLETVKINVDLQQLKMEVPLEASGSIEQKSTATCAE